MTCPKCRAQLSGETTMHRASGGSFAEPYTHAIKCWCCGYWRPADVTPAVELTAAQKKPEKTTGLKDRTRELITPYLDSIKTMRAGVQPTDWTTIANLIRQATGHPVKPQTVKRCYYLTLGAV